MEENTAESLSDNARFDCLVAECTFHENGSKVYKNIEEYNQNSSDEIAYKAVFFHFVAVNIYSYIIFISVKAVFVYLFTIYIY